jgi:chitinase
MCVWNRANPIHPFNRRSLRPTPSSPCPHIHERKNSRSTHIHRPASGMVDATSSWLRWTLCLIGLTVMLWATPTIGSAAQVTLTWDPNNPVPDGYRLYQRTDNQSYNFSKPAWSGPTSSCTVAGLADATRYFFVVRAYYGATESGNSNEVSYTTPAPAAGPVPQPVNREPVADAGPDQYVAGRILVTLNGSGSSDPDGDKLTYTWTQISGPSVQLSSRYAVRPTFTAPAATTTAVVLAFRLLVVDPSGLNAADTCQVQIMAAASATPEPTQPGTLPENGTVSNQPPAQPRIIYPAHGAEGVPLRPVFAASTFMDPDPGDHHAKTEWMILSQKDRRIVMNVRRSGSIRLRIPKLVLEPDTDYVCKTRYFDARGNASQWSPENAFTTRQAKYFLSDNDAAELNSAPADTDLNSNNLVDSNEYHTLRSLLTPDGQRTFAVGIEESENIVSLDAAIVTDPLLEEMPVGADLFPYGLLSYRIQVQEPGQQASVTLYFSEPIDPQTSWVAYGSEGLWSDCSQHIYSSEDGFTVERLITDGGPDDADGVANGVIVDTLAATQQADGQSGGASAGGGCFIRSLLK